MVNKKTHPLTIELFVCKQNQSTFSFKLKILNYLKDFNSTIQKLK